MIEIKLAAKSCLLDEDQDLRVVKITTNGVLAGHAFLRPLTDNERSQARKHSAVEPEMKMTRGASGNTVTQQLDPEKYQRWTVFYSLGGEKVLGKGALDPENPGREGWTLKDADGNDLPVRMEVLRERLNPVVLDALSREAIRQTEVSDGSSAN